MVDDTIIDLFWARNENAIREISDKYGGYCGAIARNFVDEEDARECVNDTWLAVWRSVPPNRPVNLKMYIAKITRNLALDRLRSSSAQKRGGAVTELLEELAECAAPDSAESEVEARELGKSIDLFLRTIRERDRNIFIRRYFYAEPLADIGEKYQLSSGSVSVSLFRTRRKLREYLEKEGFIV